MRCINCEAFSFSVICSSCKRILQNPRLTLREIGNFKIFSFYGYDEIKPIILRKHAMSGAFAYRAAANLSFKKFAREFKFSAEASLVPIDDKITSGYSHTAILAHAAKSEILRPVYRCLHASSNVNYSGKDLNFRLAHPRNFKILKRPPYPVILIDDVVTTATTLIEAKTALEKAGVEVLFALTLADARC